MARFADKPRFNYLDRILSRYQASGICTLHQAQEDDDLYHGKSVQAPPGPVIPIYKLGE